MKYPIKLVRGPSSARATEIGVQMRRIPAAAAVAATAAEPETLPAGTDVWYEVAARSCIPYKEYDAVMCADTDNTTFDVDDNSDYEGDIFGLPGGSWPIASAWWVITIPGDVAGCWITLDTWLTSGGDESADYPNDTNICILEDSQGTRHWPTHMTDALGDTPLDFTGLTITAESDDDPDPSDLTRLYTSKITNRALLPGYTYWIRVDCWNEQNRGQIYRLRLSLTETAPTP